MLSTIGNLSEPDANSAIADYLNGVGIPWNANAERSQTLIGSSGRPDIVIRQNGRRAVVVETEFGNPAVGDAQSRLGEKLIGETHPLTEVVAVGIDEECKNLTRAEFLAMLKRGGSVLSVQLVSTTGVWPQAPTIARPSDLSAYCEYAQVPQLEIDRRSAIVATEIESLGGNLTDALRLMGTNGDAILDKLAEIVGAESAEDASKIVCAIWLTTIDLHNDLATYSPTLQSMGLHTTQQLRINSSLDILNQQQLLTAWNVIESVNYLPVMELAKACLLAVGNSGAISQILMNLESLSGELNALQAKHIYNFAGELWQRLVADREERAAHYTKPEVAELLATLAAQRFECKAVDDLASIDLMDAACGTGTLIGAGERALRRIYLMKGGNDPNLHRKRMEDHIIALDVNGIAGTMTAKRLTDLEVAQDYQESRIAIVTHEAGSLCLLDPESTGITDMLGSGGRGLTPGQSSNGGTVQIPVGSIDWVLMNPPYSRPHIGRVQATRGLQRLRQTAKRHQWTMSDGAAGLGPDFGSVSNMRLRGNGVFAHVLPLTAAHAKSWEAWRTEMEKDFADIVAITNVGSNLESMSADTEMNELLVVARKRELRPNDPVSATVLCVNLHYAPRSLAQGFAVAKEIGAISESSKQGVIASGSYIRVNTPQPGFPWFAIGNRNFEMTSTACALMQGRIYDPIGQSDKSMGLPSVPLSELTETGPTHHLIGHRVGYESIGAFEWHDIKRYVGISAHHSMWTTDSKNKKSIATQPTHAGVVSDRQEAQRMNTYRSHWFLSRNLRWTSNAITLAKTDVLCHGGNSWSALQGLSDDVGRCIALWFNSIFGAIVRDAYGQSTQPGRAQLQVKAIAGLPCPDFGADTAAGNHARWTAGLHFNALADLELEPFAYCFRDENRWRIDEVVAEMIGLDSSDSDIADMLAHYRLMFASEPNVNGRNRGVLQALRERTSVAM